MTDDEYDIEAEVNRKMKEMEDLKKRLAIKKKQKELEDLQKSVDVKKEIPQEPVTPAPTAPRKIRIHTKHAPPIPQQMPQEPEGRDPVDRYLNPDEVFPDPADEQQFDREQGEAEAKFDHEEVRRVKQQDSNFIHKRIAAQEILKWMKTSIMLLTLNIISFFVFYMFFSIFLVLFADIVLVFAVIFDGFFLMKMRKHSAYLQQKYNIQRQPSMFGGAGVRTAPPQYRQQRAPQRQQQGYPNDYDQGQRGM